MGLNLQKADTIIYFSLPLSSELFEQSKKRIHRINQTRKCTYYIFMCENSVEQKIYSTLQERKDYTDKLFEKDAGTPDILACVNGHFIGIECKADNGRLSELQRLKLKAIQNSGGIGIVAAPCSWYDIVKLINCVSYGELDNARIIADTINSKWKI